MYVTQDFSPGPFRPCPLDGLRERTTRLVIAARGSSADRLVCSDQCRHNRRPARDRRAVAAPDEPEVVKLDAKPNVAKPTSGRFAATLRNALNCRSPGGRLAALGRGAVTHPPPLIPIWYHVGMAMTLRLTDEDEQALALLAEAQGVSKQEATVRAIRDAAARRVHEDRVRELSSSARARYADVLERLGR